MKWKRNGKDLKRGMSYKMSSHESEPTVSVDTFNTIYFHDVTSADEGNYTCDVDSVRMQVIRIFVVSKSKLLTQGKSSISNKVICLKTVYLKFQLL